MGLIVSYNLEKERNSLTFVGGSLEGSLQLGAYYREMDLEFQFVNQLLHFSKLQT